MKHDPASVRAAEKVRRAIRRDHAAKHDRKAAGPACLTSEAFHAGDSIACSAGGRS